MNKLDHGPEEDLESGDFSEMLEESIARSTPFQPGERVEGRVVHFNNDHIFIDLAGKSEAVIDCSEFRDKKGNISIRQGDTLEAYVVSTKGDEIRLSSKIGRGFINGEVLEVAYKNAMPVFGVPVKIHKGGFSVSVSTFECFCPFSHMDIRSLQEKESYLNNEYAFKIIEFQKGGGKIILSRKALLESDKIEKMTKLRETLKAGDFVSGKIISRHDFGIFVKIDDVFEALVPKSEISWSRQAGMEEFPVGREIRGKVLSIDWDKEKMTLSIKQVDGNPLDTLGSYSIGERLNGRVVNMIKSGAFVELKPGIEGFIHISRMSRVKRVNSPQDILSIGDEVNVTISGIDLENRKVSLELLTDEPDPWLLPLDNLMNRLHKGTIEVSMQNGLNVRIENGMTGFVPRKELLKQNTDVQKSYPVGMELSLAVIQVKKETRGLILSENSAFSMQERSEYEKYQNVGSSSASNTLGEQLKSKFIDIQKKLKE